MCGGVGSAPAAAGDGVAGATAVATATVNVTAAAMAAKVSRFPFLRHRRVSATICCGWLSFSRGVDQRSEHGRGFI